MMIEQVVIGRARLICGDCRDILPTLGKVDAVVTDPPYGMSFRSNHRAEQWHKIENDHDETLLLWAAQLKPLHSSYIFCRWDNIRSIPDPKSLVVWVKDNHSMGDLQHEHGRQYEVAAFYPGENHDFPGKRPTDIIKCPRTNNDHHPTEKPVQLMRAFIEWTRGVVLDPFMGSGTTGVAAVQMGRDFIGIEKDPIHFETACKRIEEAQKTVELFA